MKYKDWKEENLMTNNQLKALLTSIIELVNLIVENEDNKKALISTLEKIKSEL